MKGQRMGGSMSPPLSAIAGKLPPDNGVKFKTCLKKFMILLPCERDKLAWLFFLLQINVS